jgi:DNA-binding transcriptional MerR regulator
VRDMEDEGDRYRIGELARLSGLSVKTIRYYSDRGLVPPAERTEAGYRVYDERALARLELIRALRDLGASLADVERVLSRELDVTRLVALQLEAVEAQLRVLRVRRAAPKRAPLAARSTALSSPTASSRAPTRAPSATGSSSRSSTAGRPSRARCRRGAGRSMRCVRGRGRSPVQDYRSRANERYGGAYPLRCRLAARGR